MGQAGAVPPAPPTVPPAGAPAFSMQDAKPAPVRRAGRQFLGKISVKLVKWVVFALAAVVILIVAVTGIRYALLGYHASPERLFAGLAKAVEEEDEDLLLSLVSPEWAEIGFDESSFVERFAGSELVLYDVMMGEKGNIAMVYYAFDEDEREYAFAQAFYAVKLDGKWYLQLY